MTTPPPRWLALELACEHGLPEPIADVHTNPEVPVKSIAEAIAERREQIAILETEVAQLEAAALLTGAVLVERATKHFGYVPPAKAVKPPPSCAGEGRAD